MLIDWSVDSHLIFLRFRLILEPTNDRNTDYDAIIISS